MTFNFTAAAPTVHQMPYHAIQCGNPVLLQSTMKGTFQNPQLQKLELYWMSTVTIMLGCRNCGNTHRKMKHTKGKKSHSEGVPNQLSEMLRRYWQVSREGYSHLAWVQVTHPHGNAQENPGTPSLSPPRNCPHKPDWPGMDNDIENIITACAQCQDHLPSKDLCSHAGRNYLVWVDCYSDWPIIAPMHNNTTATHLTAVCIEILGQTAVPDILWTDRGPQFTSGVFQNFLHQWGVQHRRSTPHYPQRNGKAEATVKAMKKIIRAAWIG